jgi:ubiquinone/menaquinone biosynthesis C-methylase UbiE
MSGIDRAPNFDRLAPFYRWMEWIAFGRALCRCRCRFLDELRDCRAALVLGDGDGRFTARLLEENRNVKVEAIDASGAMLRVLKSGAGIHGDRVGIHQADARVWEPDGSRYDLIVTHFFLDCLTTDEIAALAKRLRSYTTPDTKWLVSEFAVPRGWFGRLAARPLVTGLYLSFRFLTGLRVRRLPGYRDALADAGFVLQQENSSLGGLLVSEIWVVEPVQRWQRPS